MPWVGASLSRMAGSRTLAKDAAVGWGGAVPGMVANGMSIGWPYGPMTMTIWGTSAAPGSWWGCMVISQLRWWPTGVIGRRAQRHCALSTIIIA